MELNPARRERILDATAKLIVANGLQCSISAIAATAGVATGSVYNYFSSKDDLIRGVYLRLSETIAARLVLAPDASTGTEGQIMRYIYDYIDFIWEDCDRAILFEYLSNVPLISPGELNEVFGVATRYSAQLMTDGKQAGLLADLPANTMSAYIGGGIRNTLKWRRMDTAPFKSEEREQIALMCWNAIATPDFKRSALIFAARIRDENPVLADDVPGQGPRHDF